ncbi:chromatin elongation factor SPT4 [Parastagonospora nodorum]|uniref:Transcription elongation factor SPT4 n=2 Tax=Phaeosphaeria nodorum (strain SN15 / ATCC MYA-4574 / FGSC 10173) TaxID=321614 RepID=Q0V2G9_PHANO|nr:hypothetical protein SNOG_01795 [Parastagonospora nodorum SN15]KAH3915196.1 chromatin elongation factor SPT4 [Parastagonospora nodorum]EAT91444.1 hypothetical protein SNOG_01795 [Parastagonospora nodorum SN15]KAH3930012.1 chromatin elongation factor SPT4 [Parastagonospora nodorum]KAH3955913.1 chromatin elongation factor SPT4 [Parastagonospora nodorum]KAH4007587.1 chromatin elongation factor SPT4 [Parastagonospora nodorum]
MPRKGTATVKKVDKYVWEDEYDDEPERERSPMSLDSPGLVDFGKSSALGRTINYGASDSENVDPGFAREQLKLPNGAQREPDHGAGQPRQDSAARQRQLEEVNQSLWGERDDDIPPANQDVSETLPTPNAQNLTTPKARPQANRTAPSAVTSSTPRSQVRTRGRAANVASRTANPRLSSPANSSPRRQQQRPSRKANVETLPDHADSMAQQGAYIPPNQQRHMRACMICSIVRTQQQFTTQGCPNCEEILELAGNPEQVNDCTSQVFEGLISVADTNRSWVARYQRLEGYVPGVYATQVEGILPEDILMAVENAGINYVPRDGSEQEMLGKD